MKRLTIREKVKSQFMKVMGDKKCIVADDVVKNTTSLGGIHNKDEYSNFYGYSDTNNYERRLLLSIAKNLGYKVGRHSFSPYFLDGVHGNKTVIYK
jgi:hypothetical protein